MMHLMNVSVNIATAKILIKTIPTTCKNTTLCISVQIIYNRLCRLGNGFENAAMQPTRVMHKYLIKLIEDYRLQEYTYAAMDNAEIIPEHDPVVVQKNEVPKKLQHPHRLL